VIIKRSGHLIAGAVDVPNPTSALAMADPHWRDLLLFHEHFDAETGRGLGASHQTGWTALAVRIFEDMARRRTAALWK
jgi:hypothetical protein